MRRNASIIDAVARTLATTRSRRMVPTALLALALAVRSQTAGDAAKNRPKRRKKNKGNSTGGCDNRYSEQQILGFIAKAAKKYGQSRRAMERVARCESGLDPCAVNRSGPYHGLFQFLKSTWQTTPYKDRNIYDPEAQALATAWMWKQGRKNEWACQ